MTTTSLTLGRIAHRWADFQCSGRAGPKRRAPARIRRSGADGGFVDRAAALHLLGRLRRDPAPVVVGPAQEAVDAADRVLAAHGGEDVERVLGAGQLRE